jgi:DNA polymerase III delta prime subunit
LHPYFHYHVPDHKQKRKISAWWWIVGAIVVAHVVARYGPPAPPSNDEVGWEDFFIEEGTRLFQSLVALGSVIPHVWSWCAFSIQQEVASCYEEWKRPAPCPFLRHDKSSLQWYLVEQPKAVSAVADALDAWDQVKPLFLLLTGTVGVGKLELAMQVSFHLFGDCKDAALVLDGEDDPSVSQVLLYLERQRGNGAVVILRHAEQATQMFLDVCRMFQQQQKAVFVATTSIGSKRIHQYYKRYGSMERIPHVELEIAVRDELDAYFDQDVAKHFHAIAAFLPLGRKELQRILLAKIDRLGQKQAGHQWESLVMKEDLATALLQPTNVEYIEWKHKHTGETILVFSGTGADVLEAGSPIMNKVTAQIKRCLANANPNRIGTLDYDSPKRQGVVSWCAKNSEVESCEESCRFYLD